MRASHFGFWCLTVLVLAACQDNPAPAGSPGPSAKPSGQARAAPSTRPTAAPQPPASASAKAPEGEEDPILTFAGFSKDGQKFAYASGSASGAPINFIWVTKAGSTDAKPEISIDLDYPGALAEAREFLQKEGFTGARRPPPPELTMKADLTADPPTVTLELAKRKKTSAVATAPFPPTDTAALWGLSPDGTHVAVRISGPVVKGLLSKGAPGKVVVFYRVIPMP